MVMKGHKDIKDSLISAGVKNLREFGYPECNKDNILTDMIYKEFFKRMLDDNIGKGGMDIDKAIKELQQQFAGN